MKKLALIFANMLSVFWRCIPTSFRTLLFTGMLILDSRQKNAGEGLARLFALRDKLDWIINERAMVYGEGEHPKHRLTGYHDFFIEHMADGDSVLDVGCGYGAVSRSIASAYPNSRVVGVDQDREKLKLARSAVNPSNLSFIEADAVISVPDGPWTVVVLSNVLEHIDDRVGFLKLLRQSTSASSFLIRVPLFERDWQMAMRRELRVDFRSDDDHKIEHTLNEFLFEIHESGLRPQELRPIWGEIWADCRSNGSLK